MQYSNEINFINLFQSASEETKFEEHLLKKHRENPAEELQPRIYVCGDFKNCRGCVTTVTTKYYFENPIEAFDVCFKVFFALHANYPREAVHVWEFIQKALYKISHPHDKNYTTITNLLNILKKQK